MKKTKSCLFKKYHDRLLARHCHWFCQMIMVLCLLTIYR